MPLIVASDPLGNTVKLCVHDGRRFPYFPAVDVDTHLPKLSDLPCRGDDIMLLTYAKAGTTWTWEIIDMLLNGNDHLSARHREQSFLEAVPEEDMGKLPSVRLLNTHLPPDFYPKDLIKRRNKIVFVQRNPKDVLVSFFYFSKRLTTYDYDGDWNGFFEMCIMGDYVYGSWFNWTKQWEKFFEENKELPVLRLYYEEMKMDLSTAVQQITEFLELSCEPGHRETVVKKCTFQNMQAERALPEVFKEIVNGCDNPFFRKGIVGDWKNNFTVAQNERFDQMYKQEMEGLSYPFEMYMS